MVGGIGGETRKGGSLRITGIEGAKVMINLQHLDFKNRLSQGI